METVIPVFSTARQLKEGARTSSLGLKNQSNNWCTKLEEVSDMFMTYFQQLFSSSNPVITEADLDSIPRIVTAEMNENLTKNFQA